MDDDHPLQLQIPHFVYSSAPTLVPGGGAEVIPLTNQDWFTNNGFTPFSEFFEASEPPPPLSTSAPFDFSASAPPPFSSPRQPQPAPDLSLLVSTALSAPSPLGLPVYSASGFDLLSILARVVHRPYPRVVLGPVDLSCSFVVVDVRRYDHPIVYCSPTFCTLTGYSEAEVLGRNCRFLQAPGGQVTKGQNRTFTSEEAVAHLRKSLMADKECQTSIVNYKKNGAAFINLVTVIPVPGGLSGEENDIAYHVGFQVDLTEQPNAILEKLRDGSYVVNYASHSDVSTLGFPGQAVHRQIQPPIPPTANARDRKANSIPPIVMSKQLKRLLADPVFLRSFPIPSAGPVPATNATTAEEAVIAGGSNHLLHLFLLEAAPDFIHVVSLKGSFLYVAPSVRRVLGYEAEEMIGTSLSDYAHPEDIIPLMRELKESSATGVTSAAAAAAAAAAATTAGGSGIVGETGVGTATVIATAGVPGMPRSVDLLFRARTKMGRYVWVECRGRLHVEPGKGRKAIILSGRAREMMNLKWEDVNHAGGLAMTRRVKLGPLLEDPSRSGSGVGSAKDMERERAKEQPSPELPRWTDIEQEAWGMLGGTSKETATFLSVGQGMRDVLGWTADDLLGRGVMDIVPDEGAREAIGAFVKGMREHQRQRRRRRRQTQHQTKDTPRMKKTRCFLRKKDGGLAEVWFMVYLADVDADTGAAAGVDPSSNGQLEERLVDETRGVGTSISPAALVYQIRLVDAETVECGPGSQVVPTSFEATVGSGSGSGLGLVSSLKGAVSGSSSSGSCPKSTVALDSASAPAVPPPSPLLDMFDELSIARGSSWQYELQQLRFANARLQEELDALEAVEAAAALNGGGVRKERQQEREKHEAEKQERERERQQPMQSVLPTTTVPMAQVYDPLNAYDYDYDYGDDSSLRLQQQQYQREQHRERDLFSRQRLPMRHCPPPSSLPPPPLQLPYPEPHRSLIDSHPHSLSHSHPPLHPHPLSLTDPSLSAPAPSSGSSYLHQPQPQTQFSLRDMTQGLATSDAVAPEHHHQQALGQQHAPRTSGQGRDWGMIGPVIPSPAALSLGYEHRLQQQQQQGYLGSGPGPGSLSSLKRPWNSVDSA